MKIERSAAPAAFRWRTAAVLAAACITAAPDTLLAQAAGCPAAANPAVEAGWTAYRAGDLQLADEQFSNALARCPTHPGARTGRGYLALRQGALEEAETLFRLVTEAEASSVDAWHGKGLVAWRRGMLDDAEVAFSRVLSLDPGNADARLNLDRIAAARADLAPPREAATLGPAPQRPPLVRPDTVVYPARTNGDRFEIRTANGWEPFYVKGVNIGAAMPGKYASEFPDSATYVHWFRLIGEMGANNIRTYTMHPPHFYQALRDYNLAHPDAPLWLIHGVWAELPPEDEIYDDPEWEAEFFGDIRSVVDIIHGRASLQPRPGYTHGHYTADVSPWTLGYILGREWESHSVAGWNHIRPELSEHRGRYLVLEGGTPMDAWMVRASEEVIAYEMERYNAQRPVAYTNWPTTDPMDHPMESSIMEEAEIRRALGEDINIRPVLEGEDVVTLDPMLVRATSEFPAGWYASYHVYPYFPDFMVMSREYNVAVSPYGPSNYWGYLVELKEHHRGIPLLISEYGLPSSIGIAHVHPQGWHHGGLPEQYMADAVARMTKEIAESGAAGGIVFEWIDEWFKKTWNTATFEVPLDRNRLWHNRMDAEEHYGILAMEAVPPVAGATLQERLAGWRDVAPLHAGAGGATVRAAHDASYLWVLVEPGTPTEAVMIGFDVVDAERGNFMWPGRVGERLPVGVEFVLQVTADSAILVAHPPANPIRVGPAHQGMRGAPKVDFPPIDNQPPGFFRGRWGFSLNLPLVPRMAEDGAYDRMRVLTSRSRWARDTTEIGAMGYDWGVLPRGPLPDGLWERDAATGIVEVRIPWQLINVSDPSSRQVLHEPRSWLDEGAELGTVRVDDIGIVAAVRSRDGTWRNLPSAGPAPRFTWPTWETPVWRERLKPLYDAMRHVWSHLHAPVIENEGAGR